MELDKLGSSPVRTDRLLLAELRREWKPERHRPHTLACIRSGCAVDDGVRRRGATGADGASAAARVLGPVLCGAAEGRTHRCLRSQFNLGGAAAPSAS